jgi:transcriptional regulator GlxA family with amidase domain
MNDNLHRELSLRKLASAVNLAFAVSSSVQGETGTTPAHYLHALRLARAKQLLETTSLNILQIMMRVGLRDKSHFEREFKREFGLTPTQYRQAARLVTSVREVPTL